MKASVRALLLSLFTVVSVWASPASSGTPVAPPLGDPQAAPAPQSAPEPASACGATRFTAAYVHQGKDLKVRLTDSEEGWSWDSAPLFGKPIAHSYGGGSCQATTVDLDGDGTPEVVLTLDDEAPGGCVYIFHRVAGQKAFAPVPCEVGSNLKPRDFLVWDIPGETTAPVTITPDGEIQVKGRLYNLLGQGSNTGIFHFRLMGGMMRYQQTASAGR